MKASERHKLKHDQYADSVLKAVAWARKHQNIIAIVVIVVLGVVGTALWLTWSRRTARDAAADILGEIQPQAQMALLEEPEKRADAVDRAVANYDSLAASYPDTPAAVRGLVQAGNLLVRAGKPSEALAYYKRAQAAAGDRDGLVELAQRGMAVASENARNYREAIEHYGYFAGDPASLEGVRANWDIGRCYELLGEADQAATHYEKAEQFGGDSEWAMLARFRLSAIARGEPVVPPASSPATGTSSASGPEEEATVSEETETPSPSAVAAGPEQNRYEDEDVTTPVAGPATEAATPVAP